MVASLTTARLDQQKTLCVGRGFLQTTVEAAGPFPSAVLAQTSDFAFAIEPELGLALQRLRHDTSFDMLLLDADSESLAAVLGFVREARRQLPRLPIVAFSERSGDAMRYLLREGASWHFTKRSRSIAHLARALRRHAPLISENEVWSSAGTAVVSPTGAVEPSGKSFAGPVGDPRPNPYVVGRPLTGATESLYVGREDVFAWAFENLAAAGRPNPLLLFGERRIGKTSTLYQIVHGERGRSLREGGPRRLLPAYIDLQRLAGSRTDEWLRRLSRDVYRQIAVFGLSHRLPEGRAGSDSAYAVAERMLDYLEQSLPGDDCVLLAVDELEQLRAGIDVGALDEALLPWLRSQVQHRERLIFVFSGSYGLLDSFWRPMLDLTARIELGPLNHEAAVSLMRAPSAGVLTWDDEAMERIWRATEGRPFRIQLLCHRLFSLINARQQGGLVHPADVDLAIAQLAREAVTDPLLQPPSARAGGR